MRRNIMLRRIVGALLLICSAIFTIIYLISVKVLFTHMFTIIREKWAVVIAFAPLIVITLLAMLYFGWLGYSICKSKRQA